MKRLIAMLTGLLVLGAGSAAVVASGAPSSGPVASAAKLNKKRIGLYRGTTEVGGTVSFRITGKRKVVGFTMPDVPVHCNLFQPGDDVKRDGIPFTIKAPPIKLQGVAKFLYEDPVDNTGPFQGIHVDGKIDTGFGGSFPPGYVETHMKGNAAMISQDGPAFQNGTEHCDTDYVDWSAQKVGKKK
jgi:hypothetical protein